MAIFQTLMNGKIFGIFVSAAFLLTGSATAGSNVHFGYDDQCAWEDIPQSQCHGYRQSPINIHKQSVQDGREVGLRDLQISYLYRQIHGNFTNNGHSLQFTPYNKAGFTLRTHMGEYELQQFHFHWGEYDYEGSEHRVDGKQFTGELHFVHQSTSSYASNTDLNYYTVLGVLLESDSSLPLSGTIWESLLYNIPEYNEHKHIEASAVYGDLLSSRCDPDYYYYHGSLTTPKCNEIVQWVLLRQPLHVPKEFFITLRHQVQDSHGHQLKKNFRNTQALNGRKVYQHV